MKNILLKLFILSATVSFIACKQDSPVPPTPVSYSFSEGFDSLSVAYAKGWQSINRSSPLGPDTWASGALTYATSKGTVTTTYLFPPAASTNSGQDCIFVSPTSGGAGSAVSNWMFTPSTFMKNGDKFSFFVRTVANPATRADRLQVRINAKDDNTVIDYTATAVGDYTTMLLDINPTYALSGVTAFPAVWTKYTVTLSGLVGLAKHRIAFRYVLPEIVNSGRGVGVDEVQFTSAL